MFLRRIKEYFFRMDDAAAMKRHVFYKIVDFKEEKNKYAIQCINTSAIFYAQIGDIVNDTDILYRLHPAQACYIGMEYAEIFYKNQNHSTEKMNMKKFERISFSRYGVYNILYLDREGNIAFFNKKTKEEYLMNPKDIALREELINRFDAQQAFYIGLNAGFKLKSSVKKQRKNCFLTPHYLKIIK